MKSVYSTRKTFRLSNNDLFVDIRGVIAFLPPLVVESEVENINIQTP